MSADPLDRRAMDAVAQHGATSIGLEIITRLVDAQAQVRTATLNQEAAGIPAYVLVLADTRHNRQAVRVAAPTLMPAFPLSSRQVLQDLRAGACPSANGILFA